jgi:predicted nucleotidyltransferase
LIDNKLKEIKRIIIDELEKENIKVHKIILFGSRARGDFKEDSDWDVCIIVDNDLSFYHKRYLLGRLYKSLSKIEENVEIILKTRWEFDNMKDIIGSISYNISNEGKNI